MVSYNKSEPRLKIVKNDKFAIINPETESITYKRDEESSLYAKIKICCFKCARCSSEYIWSNWVLTYN